MSMLRRFKYIYKNVTIDNNLLEINKVEKNDIYIIQNMCNEILQKIDINNSIKINNLIILDCYDCLDMYSIEKYIIIYNIINNNLLIINKNDMKEIYIHKMKKLMLITIINKNYYKTLYNEVIKGKTYDYINNINTNIYYNTPDKNYLINIIRKNNKIYYKHFINYLYLIYKNKNIKYIKNYLLKL